MNFSEKLKKIRTQQGLSQQELAEKIGVSQTAIYQWEKGTRIPKTGALIDMTRVLNISPIQLLTEKENGKDVLVSIPGMSEDAVARYLKISLTLEEVIKENENSKKTILEKNENNKKTILEKMDLLNIIGQNKAVEQVEMLTKIPEYRKNTPDDDQ